MMSLLLLFLSSILSFLSVVSAQWGMLPQQMIMPQNLAPQQYPQSSFGFGGPGPYSSSQFDSRSGQMIRPMGFEYSPMDSMQQQFQQAQFQQPQQFQPQFPMMSGVPTAMGGQGFSGFRQGLPIGMQPMGGGGQGMEMGRLFGQFQADSRGNAVEKQVSSMEPTRIIPPFLKNASPQQLDQFYAIVQNPVWSPSEKQAKIEEFVRSMDVGVQNTFAEYQRAASSESESKRQKVHKLVDDMTPEAQVQFQKVSALMTNPTLNETERLKKVQELYEKIPDGIKKEFDEKLANL